MDLTLVPFGYSESEDRLVDVHQVQSGKLCGCICPSCKAPLVARKGSKKIWHFAHDSNSEIFRKLEKCSYSFFVSARMMARQLIGDRLLVSLPDYEIHLKDEDANFHHPVRVSELVTKSKQIKLSDVVVDAEVDGYRFDILGYVDGHSLAFIFTHPGRDSFNRLENYEDSRFGVVTIALDRLKDEFIKLQTPDYSYGDILSNYISSDTKSKKWIYHPRQQRVEKIAKSKLEAALEKEKKKDFGNKRNHKERSAFNDKLFHGLDSLKKADVSGKKFRFTCRLCDSTWDGVGNTDATCANCRNALLVSRVEIDS